MYLYGVMGLAFMALTVAAGWAIVSRLRIGLTALEAVAASTVVGIVGAAWISLLAFIVSGRIDAGILASALAMAAVIAISKPWAARRPLDKSHLPPMAIMAAAGFLFMYVCLLNFHDGAYHVAYPLYGDAAYHSALVTSFSQGSNFPPAYPFMAGQPLRYTFLVDYYSAMLDRLGLGLQWSIVLPGALLLASLLATLYFFATRFTGRRAGGLLAAALVVFSGGLGFAFAFQDWAASGTSLKSLADFLANHYLNYTTYFELDLVFTNFVDVVLCERTALAGLAAGTLIVLLFYILFVEKKAEGRERTLLLFAGTLTGLLPMFHMYSYICIMMAAALFFAIGFAERLLAGARRESLRFVREKGWLYFIAPALLLALPQLSWLLGQVGESFVHFRLGWMADSLEDIPWFWAKNMGVELLLLIAGLFVVGRERLRFYLPFAGIFVVANVIIFQPWDYDNHNFFSFWLLPSAPLMAAALLRAGDLRRIGKPLLAALLVLAVLTGAMVAFFMLAKPYVIFTKDNVYVADWIKEHTPRDAVFLTGDVHNHPVTCLAGRKTYLGYYGWLGTHGIPTDERRRDVVAMLNATGPADLYGRMAQRGIGYVYIGPEELNARSYVVNRTLFNGLTPILNWTSPAGFNYRVFKAP